MKVGEKNVYINWLYYVRAGELLDVVNILTSPDLLRTVGLPARRYNKIILSQARREVKNEEDKYQQNYDRDCTFRFYTYKFSDTKYMDGKD